MSTTTTISVPSTMSTVAPSAPFEYGEDYGLCQTIIREYWHLRQVR